MQPEIDIKKQPEIDIKERAQIILEMRKKKAAIESNFKNVQSQYIPTTGVARGISNNGRVPAMQKNLDGIYNEYSEMKFPGEDGNECSVDEYMLSLSSKPKDRQKEAIDDLTNKIAANYFTTVGGKRAKRGQSPVTNNAAAAASIVSYIKPAFNAKLAEYTIYYLTETDLSPEEKKELDREIRKLEMTEKVNNMLASQGRPLIVQDAVASVAASGSTPQSLLSQPSSSASAETYGATGYSPPQKGSGQYENMR